MNRLFLILLSTLLLATSCEEKKTAPDTKAEERADSLERIIEQRENELNDMMATFNDIQEGFRIIDAAETNLNIIKDGEGNGTANKAEQIRTSMRNIQESMQHNRDLIQRLKKQVREGSIHSEEMKKVIENFTRELEKKNNELELLRADLQQKDIHIAELDKTVNDLNSNISDLREETEKKTETISEQDKQINTAWYAFGTKKELQEQNIYMKGKVLQANFNKNYFTKVDIRIDKEIKLYSKTAKIMTNHPASSYTLQQDAQKQYVLRITNPQTFWSTSKYLVVLVK